VSYSKLHEQHFEPDRILDAIEKKRKEVIAQLFKDVQSIWDHWLVDQHSDSLQCRWMVLGYIDHNLFLQGLKPLPNPPFSGFSLNELNKAFRSFDSTNECPCIHKDHIEELLAWVMSYVDEALDSFEDGLNLQQFLIKEPTQDTTTLKGSS
jgi:hypothetical protein